MTLEHRRKYVQLNRGKKAYTYEEAGMEMERTQPDFSKRPDIIAYREKAFKKPEPQTEEYYEGYDNPVKAVGL